MCGVSGDQDWTASIVNANGKLVMPRCAPKLNADTTAPDGSWISTRTSAASVRGRAKNAPAVTRPLSRFGTRRTRVMWSGMRRSR